MGIILSLAVAIFIAVYILPLLIIFILYLLRSIFDLLLNYRTWIFILFLGIFIWITREAELELIKIIALAFVFIFIYLYAIIIVNAAYSIFWYLRRLVFYIKGKEHPEKEPDFQKFLQNSKIFLKNLLS